MRDFIIEGFFIGVGITTIIAVVIIYTSPMYERNKSVVQAIQECEADLPRNKNCKSVITAKEKEDSE